MPWVNAEYHDAKKLMVIRSYLSSPYSSLTIRSKETAQIVQLYRTLGTTKALPSFGRVSRRTSDLVQSLPSQLCHAAGLSAGREGLSMWMTE